MNKIEPITAEEFDRRFDAGENLDDYIDWTSGVRPNLKTQKIELEMPVWLLADLSRQAMRLCMDRSALARVLLARELKSLTDGPDLQ